MHLAATRQTFKKQRRRGCWIFQALEVGGVKHSDKTTAGCYWNLSTRLREKPRTWQTHWAWVLYVPVLSTTCCTRISLPELHNSRSPVMEAVQEEWTSFLQNLPLPGNRAIRTTQKKWSMYVVYLSLMLFSWRQKHCKWHTHTSGDTVHIIG